MDLVKEYKKNTNFKTVDDMLKSLSSIFMSGAIKSQYKSEKVIKAKEGMNDLIIEFLETILTNDLVSSKEEKLAVIKLLDELNFRNELLQLMEKQQEVEVKKAAKTIGKKFVSSDL